MKGDFMLTTQKQITLTGNSTIDGEIAENYRAIINNDNPEDMSIYSTQVNKAVYKENRTTCRADRASFEEQAYALQEEMILEKGDQTE